MIAGREWDRTLQTLGPVLTCSAIDRRAIADAASELLQRLFSPLLIVNDANRDSKTVTLTVRAGSIPFGDPRTCALKKGALFVPVFRFLDAKGNVRKIQPVPWTYLVLQEQSEGHAQCTVASSFRAPLGRQHAPPRGGDRRSAATGTSPSRESSWLSAKERRGRWPECLSTCVPRMSGQAEKDPAGRQELLSDRHGTVTITSDPRRPLRWLEVRSGAALLARRPFVPGVEPEVTLELADDEIRLNTQRDVDLLRVQLIETVARRAALTARIRASLKTDDAANTQRLLGEMEHVPSAETYLAKLNEIRVLALEEASRRKDRVSDRRIEDLCQKTRGLIEQYLAEDRLQTLREEVNAAMSAKADAAKAAKEAPTSLLPLQRAKSNVKPKRVPKTNEPRRKRAFERASPLASHGSSAAAREHRARRYRPRNRRVRRAFVSVPGAAAAAAGRLCAESRGRPALEGPARRAHSGRRAASARWRPGESIPGPTPHPDAGPGVSLRR